MFWLQNQMELNQPAPDRARGLCAPVTNASFPIRLVPLFDDYAVYDPFSAGHLAKSALDWLVLKIANTNGRDSISVRIEQPALCSELASVTRNRIPVAVQLVT